MGWLEWWVAVMAVYYGLANFGPEFAALGMTPAQLMASALRYNAREARVFDRNNDTVVVTRALLLDAAAEIERLERRDA